MPAPLRIAVVDPSPEIHTAIASLMDDVPDMIIVRHARSLPELVQLLGECDILVADLRACLGADRAVLREIRTRCPHLRLIVTVFDEGREYEEAITGLTADAWVPKAKLAAELLAALRRLVR
ncbi:MAG: hypothetical protein HY355_01715 [Armatimonadetes bacterium]|nr:hypothetical protein [Armatimonadota bacterium]